MKSVGSSIDHRSGAALVVIVLLVIALYGLAHVMLLTARSTAELGRAYARDVALQAAADGVLAELRRDGIGGYDEVVGVRADTSDRVHRPPYSIDRTFLRLSDEAWLIEAEAVDPTGAALASRSLFWVGTAESRVAALPYAVSVPSSSGIDVRGAVTGDAPPFGSLPGPPWGPWRVAELAALGPAVDAEVRPTPATAAGACIEGPSNWGAPSSEAHPCASVLVARSRSGELLVRDGQGQGTLIVDGDLTLSGVLFHGVIIASGELQLLDGSRVVGRIVALGGFTSEPGTSVVASSAAARAGAFAALRGWPGGRPLHPSRTLGPW